MSPEHIPRQTISWAFQQTSTSIKELREFPGGPVVKNPPSNAGDAASIPGRGTKIPHATGQPKLQATTEEKPACHNY